MSEEGGGQRGVPASPKIELHVHLEGTIRAPTLLDIARRNDVSLPASTVEGLRELYRFQDFDHFMEVWILTTNALRTAEDFRQIVVDYAAEAASHGAVYIEGIFSPAERVARGVGWDTIFSGYCEGAIEAEEEHGVAVRLTPDIYRCSVSTDDPAMFDTDLGREYDLVSSMGLDIAAMYDAGVQGALCDDATRERLTAIGQAASWAAGGERYAGGSDGGGSAVNGPTT